MAEEKVLSLNPLQTKAVITLRKYINTAPTLPPKLYIDKNSPVHKLLDTSVADDNVAVNNDMPENIDWGNICMTPEEREEDEYAHFPREEPHKHNFLLLGPGGSGKTTVVINAFDNSQLRIAFCAFTNKATQVLRTVADKFNVNFCADFMTIHKLYQLEPTYLNNNETDVSFKFDRNKLENLQQYDVIIFDECSTISRELSKYIQMAWETTYFKYNKSIKHIFLGDYWQLPPVGEDKSVIFSKAVKEKWKVAKLNKVMRSKNNMISNINTDLLNWVDKFKKYNKPTQTDEDNMLVKTFATKYPFNIVPRKKYNVYIKSIYRFYCEYMKQWALNPNIVMLTYSKANCKKTNFAIQEIIDNRAKRPDRELNDDYVFYPGDRCCIDRPIDVFHLNAKYKNQEYYVSLGSPTHDTLYNGEIFDVVEVVNTRVITPLNNLKYINNYFDAQVLRVKRINDKTNKLYNIIHINNSTIKKVKYKIKYREKHKTYLTIMNNFIKCFPTLEYGYCITIYKSQGSEWDTVLINMNSIKWCLANKNKKITFKTKKALFKTTYTAISRAAQNLHLFWV